MAQYTEVFNDFLQDNELSTEWQAIVLRFNQFPVFNINNLSLDAYNMFKRRYLEREIGSETPEKFCRYINMQLDKAMVEYMPKIASFITNYSTLFYKKIVSSKGGTEKLDHTDTHTGSYRDAGSIASNDLLNPVTSTATKLKDRTVTDQDISRTFNDDKHVIDHDITFDWYISKDMDMTNAEFLKEIQEVNSYYNDLIDSFDICFMGCY